MSKSTFIRCACLLLALINMILTSAGYGVLPFDEAWLESFISDIAVIVTAIVAAWKNNSFSKAAIEGDAVMKCIKILSKHGAEMTEEFSNGYGDEFESEVEV